MGWLRMCACGQAGVLSGVVPAAAGQVGEPLVLDLRCFFLFPQLLELLGLCCQLRRGFGAGFGFGFFLPASIAVFLFSFATRLPWFRAHLNERQHAALQWLFWARHDVWLQVLAQVNSDGQG